MTTPNREVADLDPQPVKIGKWTIPPINMNTLLLLERVDSPFMRTPEKDPATGKPIPVIPKLADVARTLYVLVNAENPTTERLLDEDGGAGFTRAVSAMARDIDLRSMGQITAAMNNLMVQLNQTVTESGLEGGEGKGKQPGGDTPAQP